LGKFYSNFFKDSSIRQWNEEVIDGLFAQVEADIIKRIPLPQATTEDVLIWPFLNDGEYNCKSGYRFLKKEAY